VALRLIEEIEAQGLLENYAPLPAARGDSLYRAGRVIEARPYFERAAALTRNVRERDFLLKRAAECVA
jgi:predicted RNA polymerase sigma factor